LQCSDTEVIPLMTLYLSRVSHRQMIPSTEPNVIVIGCDCDDVQLRWQPCLVSHWTLVMINRRSLMISCMVPTSQVHMSTFA